MISEKQCDDQIMISVSKGSRRTAVVFDGVSQVVKYKYEVILMPIYTNDFSKILFREILIIFGPGLPHNS